jgi:hypothetical protein
MNLMPEVAEGPWRELGFEFTAGRGYPNPYTDRRG